MEKRSVLRPVTPGGHALINAAWIVAVTLLAASIWWTPSAWIAVGVALVALAAYLVRHQRFLDQIRCADAALDRGDRATAQKIMAPLLDRFPHIALVQKAAAEVLYASGDPLSAAALYERAGKRLADDPAIAVGLVASYAALNKAGDARRAAERAPRSQDVRLALAWAELVALGGQRENGMVLARELLVELDREAGAERTAMTCALVAIAAAQAGDRLGASAALDRVALQRERLDPPDAAFIAYLEGVALREDGAPREARERFERAMREDGSIGEALARRERSRLVGTAEGSQASESASSDQPSSD